MDMIYRLNNNRITLSDTKYLGPRCGLRMKASKKTAAMGFNEHKRVISSVMILFREMSYWKALSTLHWYFMSGLIQEF